VNNYQAIDRKLSVLDDDLSDAVSACDRAVQLQIDIARGK